MYFDLFSFLLPFYCDFPLYYPLITVPARYALLLPSSPVSPVCVWVFWRCPSCPALLAREFLLALETRLPQFLATRSPGAHENYTGQFAAARAFECAIACLRAASGARDPPPRESFFLWFAPSRPALAPPRPPTSSPAPPRPVQPAPAALRPLGGLGGLGLASRRRRPSQSGADILDVGRERSRVDFLKTPY